MADSYYLSRLNVGDFPAGLLIKILPANVGDADSIPGWGLRSHMCCNQKNKKTKKRRRRRRNTVTNSTKTLKVVHIKKKKQTLKKGLCGCHFLQEVLQITHIKLDTFLGLLSHPVLIDNTTPLTLKCTCPSASPEHKLPEDRAWEPVTAGWPENWGEAKPQCLFSEKVKYSKHVFSSS